MIVFEIDYHDNKFKKIDLIFSIKKPSIIMTEDGDQLHYSYS